ncbi:YdcF family protein [Lactobacillus sp. ESL0703]|uniref:YdcF family protein n=1 Tax=Lactobacillus sp. ESL0703 TaxID=2983218 RepID=UPI0023F641F9|nr:YdcF family protein [Lactobacillus sp. ESL0703]MDF7668664.1 YdcF family protein [Lactobacillus sp. ESL0703]
MQNITQKAANNYNTLMICYVYLGLVTGDFSADLLNKLTSLDKKRTEKFIQDFVNLEKIRQKKVTTEIKNYEKGHLFVLLGYDLQKDGSIPIILQQRLELALQLLIKNPYSDIIVSGGIPENYRTEADMMEKWLINRGIAPERIFKENKSINTIENALFSVQRARKISFSKKVTLISSVSHLRRAQILFMIADRIINTEDKIKMIDLVGTLDVPELVNHSSKEEQIVMYRDVLRINGLWLYPNLIR